MNKKNHVSRKIISTLTLGILIGIYLFTVGVTVKAMPTPEWNLTINPSTGADRAQGVTVDSQDNIIVVGYDSNTSAADKLGGYEWRIMKFNFTGYSLWNYTTDPSDKYDQVTAVANDSYDNIVAVGYDYNETSSSTDYQWRIMKFNKDKTILWINITNMTYSSDKPTKVAVDSQDNIIVVGYSPEPISGKTEWKISKFDEDGNVRWENTTDITSDTDRAMSVSVDSQRNIIVVGYDFEPTNYQWRIIKFTPSGDHIFDFPVDISTGSDQAWDVAIDSEDNIIVVGWDNKPTNYQWRIIKFNSTGDQMWNTSANPSTISDYAFGVTVDSKDNIIVVGHDGNTSAADKLGGYEWRIMKFNSTGYSLWNYTKDLSSSTDQANDVAIDSQDNIIVVGFDNADGYQWRIMKFRPNLPDGYACTSGYECQSNLCIEGYCQPACSDTYDGQKCSNTTNHYDSDGICTRIDGGWECDKTEASLYNNDYWNDCDKTVDNQECDSNSLAGGYTQDGSCQGSNCCLFAAGGSHGASCDVDSDCPNTNGCGAGNCPSSEYGDVTSSDCLDTCTCDIQATCYNRENPGGGYYQTACENCGDTGYYDSDGWNGDTNDYCCDDGDDYRITSDAQYLDNGYGSGDGTVACCLPSTDCVDGGQCTDTTQTKDADGDGDLDYCNSGTWVDCNTDAHCAGGNWYCDNIIHDCVQFTIDEMRLYANSNLVLPGGNVDPIAGSNVPMRMEADTTNTKTIGTCTVRVWHQDNGYGSPDIGPVSGTIRSDGCDYDWNFEYWRSPGTWTVHVEITLQGTSISDSDSTTFVYTSLPAIQLFDKNYDLLGTHITFGGVTGVAPGSTDVPSDNADPMYVRNIGNVAIDVDVGGDEFNCDRCSPPCTVSSGISSDNTEIYRDESVWVPLDALGNPIRALNNIPVETGTPAYKPLYFRMNIPVGYLDQNYCNDINIQWNPI